MHVPDKGWVCCTKGWTARHWGWGHICRIHLMLVTSVLGRSGSLVGLHIWDELMDETQVGVV
jgi:hypothetical protein